MLTNAMSVNVLVLPAHSVYRDTTNTFLVLVRNVSLVAKRAIVVNVTLAIPRTALQTFAIMQIVFRPGVLKIMWLIVLTVLTVSTKKEPFAFVVTMSIVNVQMLLVATNAFRDTMAVTFAITTVLRTV